MPYVIAGLTAAVVAGVEQYNRLGARFTLRNYAWVWWTLRLLLEAGIGAAAIWLAQEAEVHGHDKLVGWIAAGASGSAVVRLRVLDLGRGEDSRPVGLATAYEPLRGMFEHQIDVRSAECQSEWINHRLLPALEAAETPPAELADYLIDYLKGLPRRNPGQTDREVTYIVSLRDGPETSRVKREAMARHAISIGAFRLLSRFKQLAEGERDPIP